MKLERLTKSIFKCHPPLPPPVSPAGSPSTTPSRTTTTSHAGRMNAPCTSLTSAGGGAATTASSPRNGSSPTGRGLLTSTSTSRTGAPRLSQPTGRWRRASRRRSWCRRRRDLCSRGRGGGGGVCIERATGPLTERMGKKNLKNEDEGSCSSRWTFAMNVSPAPPLRVCLVN